MIGRNLKEEYYSMTYENYITFKFQCSQIKFYWNTATLICLHGIFGNDLQSLKFIIWSFTEKIADARFKLWCINRNYFAFSLCFLNI